MSDSGLQGPLQAPTAVHASTPAETPQATPSTPPGPSTGRYLVCRDFVWGPDRDGSKNDSAPGEKFTTEYGVTDYTWADATRRKVVPDKPIEQATRDDCSRVLEVMFYDALGCPGMPSGCDLVVFNNGMACGVGHAARLVQRVVGVDEDGDIGPDTQAAIASWGVKAFIDAMVAADEAYYAALRSAPLFLRGWDRREEAARQAAYQMAGVA